MDDGSKSRSTVYLNTQQFSYGDQNKLILALCNLGLYSSLNRDKSYLRIRLLKKSVYRFKELVAPYMIESMLYKLP